LHLSNFYYMRFEKNKNKRTNRLKNLNEIKFNFSTE
jgi:hypothetical protein